MLPALFLLCVSVNCYIVGGMCTSVCVCVLLQYTQCMRVCGLMPIYEHPCVHACVHVRVCVCVHYFTWHVSPDGCFAPL